MAQSLARNLVHLIFSTKNRVACLDREMRPRLFAYQASILAEWESPALVIGGAVDHVHVLFSHSKNHALANIVEEVKKGSSKWLKTQGSAFHNFYWQAGYAAFSVSQSNVDAVRHYIEEQEERHRTKSFQEEFLDFLQRHKVEYDERYLWE